MVELGGGGHIYGCPKYMHMEQSVALCDPEINQVMTVSLNV